MPFSRALRSVGPVIVFSLAVRSAIEAGDEPEFALDVRSRGARVEVAVGARFERDFDLVLRTANNPTTVGAQGWSLSVTSDGVEVCGITTSGTVGGDAEDGPPGLRDVGFETSELGDGRGIDDCADKVGAVSAVVLSLSTPITLPPDGEAVVARLTVCGDAPEALGETRPASIYYANGCGGSG